MNPNTANTTNRASSTSRNTDSTSLGGIAKSESQEKFCRRSFMLTG